MDRFKKPALLDMMGIALKRFNKDGCTTFAIVISYFCLLCAIPLVALFAFASTKILGNSELAFRSLNIFSDEFFAQLDPEFFNKLKHLSSSITNLGWFGLAGSFIASSFLFSKLINSINFIFKANYQKSFLYNRLMEYMIMFIMGIIMLISLFITVIWTAIHRSISEVSIIANNINPKVVDLADNFLIQYLIPFTLTFIVLFCIYKFIPEIKVHTRAAALASVIAALLWEIFKRIFAFYVAHFSAIGIVLSKLLKGSLTSIIFFLLWITFSLSIMLWGAELAAIANERIDEKEAV